MRDSPRPIAAALVVCALAGLGGCESLIATQKSLADLEDRRGFTWETHDDADGFVIHVEPESTASRNVEAVAANARHAKERVLRYLDETDYAPTVSIFAVEDRDRMEDLIGRRTNATAYHASNALCLIWSGSGRASATHELLHVVAMNTWGVPDRWVNEGAAVDATGPWRGHDLHAVCKRRRADGTLPSLSDITRRFNALPSTDSYPAAGSFIRYLRETYGLATLRAVWDGGDRVLPEVTGLDLAALEAAWLDVVEQADAGNVEPGDS